MGVKGMLRANAVTLTVLILLNLALMSLGRVPWVVLGLLALAVGGFMNFRMGMFIGHEACGIRATVERTLDPESPGHGQLDKKYTDQAWSRQRGIKALLASALLPYVTACVYIIVMLLKAEKLIPATRVVSWVLALPWWPTIALWYEVFDRLTPAIVAVLMLTPFILPACTYAGYLQGPKLWQKSEQAMAEGRRRAKAKSRVVRKRPPKAQKPEI